MRASWDDRRDEDTTRRAQGALTDHDVFPARIQLHLAASPDLAEMSRVSVHLLIAYRDAVVGGEPHREAELEFTRHRAVLMRAMRAALSRSR
ncbi:hypothetical protein [Streptomyces chrestomyceticus]|uniref:hypothetical protein n=1 Tax=Streptomyces chrestomyceticus TaxID=68185 RepID=UPI0037A01FA7